MPEPLRWKRPSAGGLAVMAFLVCVVAVPAGALAGEAGGGIRMAPIDWVIVVGYLVFGLIVCSIFVRRAGRGTSEFFASGRALPWWLLGTSMVATTFSTDTPNLVTDIVRKSGVAGNWVWWAFLITGMMTVFLYAKLWRRSKVLTDLEFYEIRYGGKSAAAVRCFRAVYLGLFFNCVIMASVTLAAVKIAAILFGADRAYTVLVCSVVVVVFSVLSGLWGVVVTDLVQFIMAMVGAFAAAYFAVKHPDVGGLSGMLGKIDPGKLNLLPDFGNWDLLLTVLIVPIAVQWWSVWYPGAEPGGGSYIAQRMLAAKDEKHSMGATLWFNIAHYALRPWPWIIVALCSLIVFPQLSDIKAAFPGVSDDLLGNDIAYPAMLKFLPAGFLGVMVGSLMAAYISTMDTHLNWGASYLVHDLYRRFIYRDPTAGDPDATDQQRRAVERHYVLVGRLVTVGLMGVAASFVFFMETAKDNFDLMLQIGAGTGLIYLLRWFWWRVNAWSEIAAMISSFGFAVVMFVADRTGADAIAIQPPYRLIVGVGLTTVVWVVVTFLTPPSRKEVLMSFYRLVRPAGPGWKAIRAEAGLPPSPDSMSQCLLGWFLACVVVYAALFGAGCFLYGRMSQGIAFAVVFGVSVVLLMVLLAKTLSRKESDAAQSTR